jgi:ubiquinone/menaquinone biosynthesis C-methylase UbiE
LDFNKERNNEMDYYKFLESDILNLELKDISFDFLRIALYFSYIRFLLKNIPPKF